MFPRPKQLDLGEELQLLRIVSSLSEALIYFLDTEGRFRFVSPEGARFVRRSPWEMIGRSWEEVGLNPSIMAPFEELRRAAMRMGKAQRGRIPRPTESGKLLEYIIQPARDEEGEVIGTVVTAEDVTERTRALDQLRDSEALFRLIAENARDIVYRIRVWPELRYEYVSPSVTGITGYTPEEHYADPRLGAKIIHPDDLHLVEEIMAEPERVVRPLVLRWKRKDGEIIWTEQLNVPLYMDGRLIAIEGVARDITERMQAEEALRESEELFRGFVEQSADGVALIDEEGRIIEWNRGMEVLTGYSREEILGRTFWDVQHMLGAEEQREAMPLEALKGIIAEALKSGKAPFFRRNPEARFRHADGHERYVQQSAFPIKTPRGHRIGTIARDITDRVELESEKTAEKERAELYLDLLTHDVKNFNAAALGYLQLASSKGNPRHLDKAQEALERITRLLDSVSKLQSVERSMSAPHLVDLDKILSGVVSEFSDISDREVTVVYQGIGPVELPSRGFLRDVFYNLIGNAIKHSTGPLEVIVRVQREEVGGLDLVRVDVEDTGPGIDEELKKQLFVRFQRGSHTVPGRGLGLYLVKYLVEDLGGWVRVEDRMTGDLTQGTRFVVYLPTGPGRPPA